jgi:hypothetical protein
MKHHYINDASFINQSINQQSIMKSLIFILGVTLVSFTNVCNGEIIYNKQFNADLLVDQTTESTAICQNQFSEIKRSSSINNLGDFDPDTVLEYNQKTNEEIIKEGELITEFNDSDDIDFVNYEKEMKVIISQFDLITENSVSHEIFSLTEPKTIENQIAEWEQIIESYETNEVHPLDFNTINCESLMTNSFNSKRFIGMN